MVIAGVLKCCKAAARDRLELAVLDRRGGDDQRRPCDPWRSELARATALRRTAALGHQQLAGAGRPISVVAPLMGMLDLQRLRSSTANLPIHVSYAAEMMDTVHERYANNGAAVDGRVFLGDTASHPDWDDEEPDI